MSTARQFVAAVTVLAAGGPDVALPLTLIAGQAVENALSSFLTKSGKCNEADLVGMKHSLEAMWSTAGLSAQPPRWLNELNGYHGWPYLARYGKHKNVLLLPIPASLAYEVRELVRRLCADCDAIQYNPKPEPPSKRTGRPP